jgi:hypothetical protein
VRLTAIIRTRFLTILKTRNAAIQKHKKSGVSEVKILVLECLVENGAQYRNKTAFIKDMLEKYGDRVTSSKTIERYIDGSGHVVPHWRSRKRATG